MVTNLSGAVSAFLCQLAYSNPTAVFCKKMRTCEQPDAVYFVVDSVWEK